MFTKQTASSTTSNRQIGAQVGDNSSALSISGQVRGNDNFNSGTIINPPKKVKGGYTVNVTTTDYGSVAGALHFAEQASDNVTTSTMAALQASVITTGQALDSNNQITQALLEANTSAFNTAAGSITDVATQAINMSQQVSINSLGLAKSAVDSAQYTALNATPVSEGRQEEIQGEQFNSQLKIAAVGAVAIVIAALVAKKYG